MHAVACILSCDGCSGMTVAADGMDKLTSMVNATNLGKPPTLAQPTRTQPPTLGQPTRTQRYGNRPKGSSAEFINHGGFQNGGPSKASTSTSSNIGNPSGISS